MLLTSSLIEKWIFWSDQISFLGFNQLIFLSLLHSFERMLFLCNGIWKKCIKVSSIQLLFKIKPSVIFFSITMVKIMSMKKILWVCFILAFSSITLMAHIYVAMTHQSIFWCWYQQHWWDWNQDKNKSASK